MSSKRCYGNNQRRYIRCKNKVELFIRLLSHQEHGLLMDQGISCSNIIAVYFHIFDVHFKSKRKWDV